VAAEGKALARVNEKVLFTTFAVPGDVVDIQITNKRKSYLEGYVVNYREYSPLRTTPFCEHFGMCGGCKWQNLPYSEQLKFKQKQVVDQLTRIAKVELPEISPIIGSAKTTHYRNKLEFTFSESRWLSQEEIASGNEFEPEPALGYHIPGKFDKVFDVKNCYLQPEPSNSIRLAVRDFATKHNLPFLNLRSKEGLLRNIIVRTASTGDVMVILVVKDFNDSVKELLNFIKSEFPQITSLFYVVNQKVNDTINDLSVELFHGKDHILEEMEGIKFKVGPKSFYQTNSEQAYELYKVARNFADIKPDEHVYDLYTGTGTIANFVAAKAKHVVGVEYVPEAIDDAKVNSEINSIKNTSFFAGDIKDLLTEAFMQEQGYPDVVILDPPRAGVHPDVLDSILHANPKRIVYVSCNPASQARDIAILDKSYKVTRVQPVDMFPHTHHVENVVLMEKRG
ncbi:MAG TPA: 23S rRNA (uracil(1939)-C(5))-methyltransferase RlmD, partial [Tenuifilaceae bacterium]|nr:23S rRNA (uracil(1939)-C(5))-methyltransferase RlmD [Tenuifilaceae bacterium]